MATEPRRGGLAGIFSDEVSPKNIAPEAGVRGGLAGIFSGEDTAIESAPVESVASMDDPKLQEALRIVDNAINMRGQTTNIHTGRPLTGRIMDDDEQREYTKNSLLAAATILPTPAMAGVPLVARMAGWGTVGAITNAAPSFIAGEDASDVLEEAKTGFLWGAGGAGVLAGAGAAFSKLSPFARQMAAKLDNDAIAGKLMSVDEAIATRGATREMVKDFTETQLEKARVRAPMVFREYMDRQLRSLGEKGIDPKELTVDAQARWETAVRAKGGSINMQDLTEHIMGLATQELNKPWMNRNFVRYLKRVHGLDRAAIKKMSEKGIYTINDVEAEAATAKFIESHYRKKSNLVADIFANQWVRGMAAKMRTSPRFGRIGQMLAQHIDEWNQNRDLLTANWDAYLDQIKMISPARQEEIGRAIAGKIGGVKARNLNLTPFERQAMRRWYALQRMIAKEFDNSIPIWGTDIKGKPRMMAARADFGMPLYFDPKKVQGFLTEDTVQRRQFLQDLVKANKFKTEAEALKWAEQAGLGSDIHWGDSISGSLHHARTTLAKYLDPEYRLDNVFHRYIRHASGALTGQRLFGANNVKLKTMIDGIENVDTRKELRAMLDAVMERPGTGTSSFKTGLTHWLALSRFGQHTGLLQLSQLFPAAITYGPMNTLKALLAESSPTFRRIAARVGAHLPVIVDPDAGGKFTTRWMGATGVRPADRMGRTVGGIAAAFQAHDLAREAVRFARRNDLKKMAEVGRKLNKFGVSLEDVLRNGGELSEGQLRRVISEGSNIVNFASRRADLPSALYGIGRNTGRAADEHQRAAQEVVFTLGSFTTQATNWFEREVVMEAAKGNIWPALRFAAVTFSPLPLALRAMYDKSRGMDSSDSDALALMEEMNPQALKDPEYLKELAQESMWSMFEMGLMGRYSQLMGDFAPNTADEYIAGAVGPGYTIPVGQLVNTGRGVQQTLTEGDPELLMDTAAKNLPMGAYWRMLNERMKNR